MKITRWLTFQDPSLLAAAQQSYTSANYRPDLLSPGSGSMKLNPLGNIFGTDTQNPYSIERAAKMYRNAACKFPSYSTLLWILSETSVISDDFLYILKQSVRPPVHGVDSCRQECTRIQLIRVKSFLEVSHGILLKVRNFYHLKYEEFWS